MWVGLRVLLDNSASPGGGGSDTPHPLGPPPPPSQVIGQIFLRVFGQSKIFSGAFAASQFTAKTFFGAFGAPNNSGSPEGRGGVPPTARPTHPPWTPPPQRKLWWASL